jgi:hypothetical protein
LRAAAGAPGDERCAAPRGVLRHHSRRRGRRRPAGLRAQVPLRTIARMWFIDTVDQLVERVTYWL